MHTYRDQYVNLFRGGRDVVMIGLSTDSIEDLQSWAEDDEFPFLMATDPESAAAAAFGMPLRPSSIIQTRTVFVIGPDGTIAHVAAPFREIDPTAYEELAAAIDRVTPPLDDESRGLEIPGR